MSDAKRRDDLVGRVAASALGGGRVEAEDCPDAALLAEWHDAAPDSPKRAGLTAHLASCARCQAVIASLARIDDEVRVPEPGAARPDRARARLAPWVWRWAFPAAAALAAGTVWFVVRPPAGEFSAPPAAPTTQLAEARAPSESALPAARAKADSAKAEPSPPAAAAEAPVPPEGAPPAVSTKAEPQRPAPTAVGAAEPTHAARADEAPGGVGGERSPGKGTLAAGSPQPVLAPLPPPPPPPLPVSEPARAEAARLATERMTSAKEGRAVAAEPAAAAQRPAAADVRADAFEAKQVAARGLDAAAGTLEIRSPDRAVFWRVNSGNRIARSADGGRTWRWHDLDRSLAIRAGSAASRDACWMVGLDGLVLLTTDGTTWERAAPPSDADLVGVEAVSALAATVTTREGRRFSTIDGGRSWTPLD